MTWNVWTDFLNLLTGGFTQAKFDQLVADIQGDVQIAESDLAAAAAWIVANGPNYVTDAQTLVAVLKALTGNLTIPGAVLSALGVAITDMQQFIGAVGKVTAPTVQSVVGALTAIPDGNEAPGTLVSGYKMHQSLIAATAAARGALANATKK